MLRHAAFLMKIVPGRLSWLACVAAVSLLLTSRPAGAEPVTSGVVVANTGGKDTLQFRQWQSFRQALDEKTSGSILLDYLIFGELGGTRTMAEAVISGRADIGSFTCNGLTSLVPELAVTALPFLFGSEDEAAFVMDKYLTPAFSSLLDKRGLVFLQWSDFSWMDLYARIPVQLPAQLEGQDIRTIDNIRGPQLHPSPGGQSRDPVRFRKRDAGRTGQNLRSHRKPAQLCNDRPAGVPVFHAHAPRL